MRHQMILELCISAVPEGLVAEESTLSTILHRLPYMFFLLRRVSSETNTALTSSPPLSRKERKTPNADAHSAELLNKRYNRE